MLLKLLTRAVGRRRAPAAAAPEQRAARIVEADRLLREGDARGAAAPIAELLRTDPEDADALYLRGRQQRLDEDAAAAQASFARAVALRPDLAPAYYELARGFELREDYPAAVESYRAFLRLAPQSAEAHNNLGWLLLFRCGGFEEGIAACERALALRPDFLEAHFNIAYARLGAGQFAQGWKEYEWRPHQPLPGSPEYDERRWRGEAFAGRRLLLRGEQGLGDTLMVARFLPRVRALGGEVLLQCDARLARLFAENGAADRLIDPGATAPPFDLQLPLMSLPLVLGLCADELPGPTPYIAAQSERVAAWSARVGGGAARKVGIVWAGNPQHIDDRQRSVPARLFARLAPLAPKLRFYSLQVGPASRQGAELPFTLADFTSDLGDFADTAALIANLDLVISVDTAVVHLAGALGKATWVLCPYWPDWRWRIAERISPWYPRTRVFPPEAPGIWEPVMDRIAVALEEWLGADGAPGRAQGSPS